MMKKLLYTFLALTTLACASNPEDFTVKSATGNETFVLKEAKGKIVALHFLLKTECPVCLRHTRDYFTKSESLQNVIQVFLKPDTDREIESWAKKLPPEGLAKTPIYRDPNAKLAKDYNIPDGYAFHGQSVHFPATILLNAEGKEVFRYVGKNNGDRLSFEALSAKVAELTKP
jgi:peroxiredoxin Q/BCP